MCHYNAIFQIPLRFHGGIENVCDSILEPKTMHTLENPFQLVLTAIIAIDKHRLGWMQFETYNRIQSLNFSLKLLPTVLCKYSSQFI